MFIGFDRSHLVIIYCVRGLGTATSSREQMKRLGAPYDTGDLAMMFRPTDSCVSRLPQKPFVWYKIEPISESDLQPYKSHQTARVSVDNANVNRTVTKINPKQTKIPLVCDVERHPCDPTTMS